MIYVFFGISVVFVYFVLWALIKANSFKAPAKEKAPAPIVSDGDYVLVKEEKPKKVKIKKEEKPAGETTIVKVFGDEEDQNVTTCEVQNEEKEKDELLRKYLQDQEELNSRKTDDLGGNKADEFSPLNQNIDDEIERRIAELRARNGLMVNGRAQEPNDGISSVEKKNQDPNYYGFGVGLSGHSHGSMKDPNFNPWPDESPSGGVKDFSTPDGGSFGDFDDDFADIFGDLDFNPAFADGLGPKIGPRFDGGDLGLRRPSSRLGGGSVKSQVNGRIRPNAENMIVGSAINKPKFGNKPIDADGDFGDIGGLID